MQLAHLDNKLISPSKNKVATCPLCNGEVHAKCGVVNIHHWAHRSKACDNWSEPETYWHKSWKESFPEHFRETVIEKNGKKHFADLYTDKNVIIELQNSSIKSETIQEREQFYGNRMLWVLNAGKYRERIYFYPRTANRESYHPAISLSHLSINQYLSFNQNFTFHWNYPVRSWTKSKRPVFLDIHEDFMLWIVEGMGSGYGKCQAVSKKRFFEKYNGDFAKYSALNSSENLYDYEQVVEIINKWIQTFNVEYSTYSYPPWLSLKVYDNMSLKTSLNRVRWNDLMIPNGNSKGLFFLFGVDLYNPDVNGVYIDYATEGNIKSNILCVLKKDENKKIHHLANKWQVQYMASIPWNEDDASKTWGPKISYVLQNLKEEFNSIPGLELIDR